MIKLFSDIINLNLKKVENNEKGMDYIVGNYSVVSKALYLGILKNLKIEFLTKKLKNNYFLVLLE